MRLAAIGGITAGLVIVCFVLLCVLFARPKPPVNAIEVQRAIQQFCADHRSHPPTVTFSQLIAQGYLASNILQRFGASEVTVNLNVDETHPEMFLMDALMPDGSHTTALADGSVQGFSKSRFQQLASPNGGPATPTASSGGSGEGRHR
jgi:hypothetical protein